MTGAAAARDGAYRDWREAWLSARPEWRLIEVFHPVARGVSASVLEMLAQEWLDAALSIREPEVARRKLGWWLDELGELAHGRARHPLTVALADAAIGRDASVALARAAGEALALIETESIASSAGLVEATIAFARAFAEAGATLGAWRPVPSDRMPALAAALLSDLVRDWPRFARPERGLVPLALLARHGLDRAGAQSGHDAGACDALLRDFARDLAETVDRDHRGDLMAARLAAARAWLDAIGGDPRAAREGRLVPPRLRLLWSIWRAARGGGAG